MPFWSPFQYPKAFRLPAGNLNAFGYWNGDQKGNMVATAFDADDNVLGSVSAAISGGFAGLVSVRRRT